MTYTTYSLEIETQDDYIIVDLECEMSVENNGIGPYEFWGTKCYDKGIDYLVLDKIDWDKTLFTEKENKIIEEYLKKNWEKIERAAEQQVYDVEIDGDDYYEE